MWNFHQLDGCHKHLKFNFCFFDNFFTFTFLNKFQLKKMARPKSIAPFPKKPRKKIKGKSVSERILLLPPNIYDLIQQKTKTMYIVDENNHWLSNTGMVNPLVKINNIALNLQKWLLCYNERDLSKRECVIYNICDNNNCLNPNHCKHYKPGLDIIDWNDNEWTFVRFILNKKSEKDESTGCRIWTGDGKTSSGYGRIDISKKRYVSSVLSYMEFHRVTSLDKMVCHKCDNPLCIEPSHLFLGTIRENMNDAQKKGRKSDMDIEKVREIKYSVFVGSRIKKAKYFGISTCKMESIEHGWPWLGKSKEEDDITKVSVKEPQKCPPIDPVDFEKGRIYIEKHKIVQELTDDEKIINPELNDPHWMMEIKEKDSKYARCIIRNRHWLTHRLSYFSYNEHDWNEENKKLFMLHKCKEKACCNPNHLKLGTAKENMQDRKRDGTHLVGEKRHNVTISEEDAIGIIKSKGLMTQTERAIKFKTSMSVIIGLDSNRSWKYLDREKIRDSLTI
jgi:HNH endonuclease